MLVSLYNKNQQETIYKKLSQIFFLFLNLYVKLFTISAYSFYFYITVFQSNWTAAESAAEWICNRIMSVSSLRISVKLSACILITVKNDQINTIQQCESWKTFFRLVIKLYEAMLIRLIRIIRLTWSSISENSLDQIVFFVWLD